MPRDDIDQWTSMSDVTNDCYEWQFYAVYLKLNGNSDNHIVGISWKFSRLDAYWSTEI